jgi:oligopeptide/dipeptide ABC transporter ATP-binding protein
VTTTLAAPLCEVRGLEVRFAARRRGILGAARWLQAVRGVDFSIAPGGALGLVGESGCGKSTVARAVVGLQAPSAGSILLDGLDRSTARGEQLRALRRKVGIVFQDPYASLEPRQPVSESVLEPLAIAGALKPRVRRMRVLAAFDAVGLDSGLYHRYPHELSGGQRQRVAIARALVLEPRLLVCDEPTSALDLSVRAQIVNLLADLRARFGLALLFISHDLAVVRRLVDHVAVMYLGRIVEHGPRDALFEAPQHPYTQALLSAVVAPHARDGRERIVLSGELPSPLAPPPGCAFHPRCFARERVPGQRCESEDPQLLESGAQRRRACHLPRGD